MKQGTQLRDAKIKEHTRSWCNIALCTHSKLILSAMQGELGCYHPLTVMNNVAVTVETHLHLAITWVLQHS